MKIGRYSFEWYNEGGWCPSWGLTFHTSAGINRLFQIAIHVNYRRYGVNMWRCGWPKKTPFNAWASDAGPD